MVNKSAKSRDIGSKENNFSHSPVTDFTHSMTTPLMLQAMANNLSLTNKNVKPLKEQPMPAKKNGYRVMDLANFRQDSNQSLKIVGPLDSKPAFLDNRRKREDD
jgi:ubiquinone biosynthesis protein Coq4